MTTTPRPFQIDQAKMLARNSAFLANSLRAGGITVDGVPVGTGVLGLVLISGAANRARADAGFTTEWVASPTQTVTLDAGTILAIETATSTFVAACFAAEAQVNAGLNATPPTITTVAQVKAVYDAVSKTY